MANRFARGWDYKQLKFLVCAGKTLLCSRSKLIEFHGCRIKPIYCVTRMLFEEVISYETRLDSDLFVIVVNNLDLTPHSPTGWGELPLHC